MRRLSPSGAFTVVFAASAMGVAGYAMWQVSTMGGGPPELQPRPVENWNDILALDRWEDPSGAGVNVAAFTDFQCGFCAEAVPLLLNLRDRHPDRLRVIILHFPIEELHPIAFEAAVAAECAREQGRFRAMHDALYERQVELSARDWTSLGRLAEVQDLHRLITCIAGEETIERVRQDLSIAEESGVMATPTFVIDGTLHIGSSGLGAVRDALARSSP